MKQEDLSNVFRNLMKSLFPELGSGTHLPHKARVLGIRGSGGMVKADGTGERRYSLDVEPLTPDGEPDFTRPVLNDVPLEVFWTGADRGVLALPAVGSIVRVCYYGGSSAHPYIDGIVPDGWSVPGVQDGQLLVQHRPGTSVSFEPDGTLVVTLTEDGGEGGELNVKLVSERSNRANVNLSATDKVAGANLTLTLNAPEGGNLTVKVSGEATVQATKNVRVTSAANAYVDAKQVHLAGGGPGVARLGDRIEATGTDATGVPVTVTGTIVSASTRVTSG